MKNDIGSRIRQSRKKRGMTQEQLGNIINTSSQVISNWEREYTPPDSFDIKALSNALQVSSDYLLGQSVSSDRNSEIRELSSEYSIINDDKKTIELITKEAKLLGLSTSDPEFLEMLSDAFKMLRIARRQDYEK